MIITKIDNENPPQVKIHSKFECSECSTIFKNKHKFIEHLKKEHGIFRCLVCDEDFQSYISRLRHIDSEHGYFYCPKCQLKTVTEDGLKPHFKSKHSEFPCPKSFEYKGSNSIKSTSVADAGTSSDIDTDAVKFYPFKCVACSENFITKAGFNNHKRDKHPGQKVKVHRNCPYCLKSFTKRSKLRKHKKDVHENDLLVQQQQEEEEEDDDDDDYHHHSQNIHKRSVDSQQQQQQQQPFSLLIGKNYCDKCKVDLREDAFEDHFEIEHAIYQCSVCSEEFVGNKQYKEHVDSEKNPINVEFNKYSKKQMHQPLKISAYMCLVCRELFLSFDGLNIHNQCH